MIVVALPTREVGENEQMATVAVVFLQGSESLLEVQLMRLLIVAHRIAGARYRRTDCFRQVCFWKGLEKRWHLRHEGQLHSHDSFFESPSIEEAD